MEYIDEYVASEVCASKEDFQHFLVNDPVIGYSGSSPPVNISFRAIRSGVERYFSAIMDHYFSGDRVSKLQWLTAEFDCQNLPVELRYIWKK